MHNNPQKFTEGGLYLLEEARAQANFGKDMANLATQVPKTEYKLKDTNSVPSICSLLSKVGDMFEKYHLLQYSIVFQSLRAIVFDKCVSRKNITIDPKLMSFYSYLHALNPIACESVAGNLGGSPSIRWIEVLNARERVSCIL